jgi:hypothetical protein
MMRPNEEALPEFTCDSDANERRDQRLPWTAPRMRRLAASSAELGAGDTVDAEGLS